jgi:hypothetical protein
MRGLGLSAIAVSFVVAGCATTFRYHPDWPPVAEAGHGRCHHIEGRYSNPGVSGGSDCPRSGSGSVYTWDCDIDLSSNILSGRPSALDRGRASRWVVFKHPDDNTLVIELDDGKAPIILKQSGYWTSNQSQARSVPDPTPGYEHHSRNIVPIPISCPISST